MNYRITIGGFGILAIAILIMFGGCEETIEKPLDFSGDLRFAIFSRDEFGQTIQDRGDFKITLSKMIGDSVFYTDTSGIAIIEDLPMGNYQFRIEKQGYGEVIGNPFRFIGDTSARHINWALVQKSSVKILDFEATLDSNNLRVSGTISHNFSEQMLSSRRPGVRVFVGTDDKVDNINSDYSRSSLTMASDPTKFEMSFNLFNYILEGEAIYLRVYGNSTLNSNPSIMGEPSDVLKIPIL